MASLSSPIQHSPKWVLLSLALTAAAHGAQAPEEDTYADPYGPLTMPLGGTDDAVPLSPGSVFHEPALPNTAASAAARVSAPLLPMPDQTAFGETVHFVEHGGTTWMRGPTYKASVSEDGFTYVPFLGAKAPRNYPIAFRLQEASLGGVHIPLSPKAEVSQNGQRFVLDRGPVDVIYEVDSREVEQLFSLDIAGASADLVLTLRVSSDLVGSPSAGGFRFSGPSGGMDYGSATVLDGAGHSAPLETTLDGDLLQITVPAAFLARAEGEVVIDPILSTYTVDGTSGDQREVDVAYDETTDTFTFVYEDTFSGNDADIYRRTLTRTGALVSGGLVFGDDKVWRGPAIAGLNGEDKNLIVASVTNTGGHGEIMGRLHTIPTNTLGPDLLIGEAGANGFDNLRPDVGGNARNQPGFRFMVVWERRISPTQHSVRIRAVESDGTLGQLYSIQDRTDVFQEEVSISQSAGDPTSVNVWNVVWRNQELLTDTDSIRGAQLTTNVFLASQAAELYRVPPGQRLREIDVSVGLPQGGFESTYLVTYDNYVSGADEATLLVVRDNVLRWRHQLADLEHANPAGRRNVRLGATVDRFVVTCEDLNSDSMHATVLQLIGEVRFGVVERRVNLGPASLANRGGAAVSTVASGGATGPEAGIGWSNLESTGDYGATGVTLSVSATAIPGYHFCVSRPNSTGEYGFLTMSGTPSLSQTKVVTAENLPPNQFAILLVGTVRVNIPMIGGSQGTLCLGGQFGRYNSQIASSGSSGVASFLMDPAAIPAPFGTDAALAGELFCWQAWHRDVAGGNATSNLTNAFAITFE